MTALLVAALAVVAFAAARAATTATRRGRAVDRLARPRAASAARHRLPPAPAWLRARLAAAAIPLPPDAVAATWLAGVVVVPPVALVVAGAGLAVALAALTVGGPWLALRVGAGRGDARVEAAMPAVLEEMARTLRTGGSLRQAVTAAATSAPPAVSALLAGVNAQVEHGAPLAVALDTWVDAAPLPAVRLAVAALALGADTGGAQARAVDGVAATIRERLAAAAETRAQATQARASAVVIALAPLAFCALASASDARTATFLFRSGAGFVLLSLGLGLDALGAVWMGRITRVP